jgi:hypothetical protein
MPQVKKGIEQMTNLILGASLLQALSGAAGIIAAIGFIVMVGALIGACVEALMQRHVGGVKVAIVIAAVAGLAFVICGAMWAAGGMPNNINITAIN